MALRDIVKEPDERLRKVCRPVKEITPHILTLLDDMAETMAFAEGVGLAAPQVGVLRRIVVVDVGEGLIELINPEILEVSGEQTEPEACLSCGDRRGIVTRPSFSCASGRWIGRARCANIRAKGYWRARSVMSWTTWTASSFWTR